MASSNDRKIVLVTRRTRLEELLVRFHTLEQAKFYIEHLNADFADYQHEHATYHGALAIVAAGLRAHGRYQVIDRDFLPNFIFGPQDLVIALGQDGLVANILKYLDGQPLAGVNPDPARHDGQLLPFAAAELPALLPSFVADRRPYKTVTMARATLADGQVLHAVNDLFIGPKSHTSARYEIALGKARETQSSSGVIVSTGLGSTGWMTSVMRGAFGVTEACAGRHFEAPERALPWDVDFLRFAVREPFPSKYSQANLVYGEVRSGQALQLVSLMPENGVIFSDGLEADHLDFNAGTHAYIEIAQRQGRLLA